MAMCSSIFISTTPEFITVVIPLSRQAHVERFAGGGEAPAIRGILSNHQIKEPRHARPRSTQYLSSRILLLSDEG
jgi:hypothetical protein